MGKGRGKKFKTKGSLNREGAYKRIGKRSAQKKKQNDSMINANPNFVPITASAYASTPVHPHVPTFASALTRTANGSWAAIQEENRASGDQISGYIFMCNGKTKPECYRYHVFGLPAARWEVVEKIKPNTKLFLFDFDLKLLHGVYTAASNGQLGLEPTAFGGKFPAQVRFEIFKDCLPLPESAFKHVIKDNYQGRFKFRQELSNEQVNNLISLFRPIAVPARALVTPLMPNTVQPPNMLPRGIEKRILPPANLPSADNQYVDGVQLSAGAASDFWHVRQAAPRLSYEPHASIAQMVSVQPAVPSKHLVPAGPQPYFDPYYPAEAHQTYWPENPPSNLPSACNQYVDGVQLSARPASDFRHVRQAASRLPYEPHASVAQMASVQPAVQSKHLVPSGPQPYCDAYYPAEADQTYWPENPPSNLPSADDQYVDGVQLSAGPASDFRHVRQAAPLLPYEPHALVAQMASVQPAVQSKHVQAGPQPYCDPCYPAETHQTNWPENPILPPQDPYGRYTVPGNRDGEIVPQLGAANGYYNHSQVLAATNAPALTHSPVPSLFPAPSQVSVQFPSSSVAAAAYWTYVASEDANQVYSSHHQRLPLGSTGVGGRNVPVSFSGAAPIYR